MPFAIRPKRRWTGLEAPSWEASGAESSPGALAMKKRTFEKALAGGLLLIALSIAGCGYSDDSSATDDAAATDDAYASDAETPSTTAPAAPAKEESSD